MTRLLFLPAAALALTAQLDAQTPADPPSLSRIDTTAASGIYPIGDAVDVYRAALDLLYIDGKQRPSVIVVHDTAEPPGSGACPIACKEGWAHKSRIDTSTILAFALLTPKRLRIQPFPYPVPIVLVSYNDRERMRHEGLRYLAQLNLSPSYPEIEERIGFTRQFPGAWGRAEFSKVGFNTRRTEALVQVRHWCGEQCASAEVLFLRKVGDKWRVIERIPANAESYQSAERYPDRLPPRGNLRYRGPAGKTPGESELVSGENLRDQRLDPEDVAAVYRTVLDSLYNFQGDFPRMVVLTHAFPNAGDATPVPRTRLDPGLIQKYSFLSTIHGTPDSGFRYRVPIRYYVRDYARTLERLGAPIAQQSVMKPMNRFLVRIPKRVSGRMGNGWLQSCRLQYSAHPGDGLLAPCLRRRLQ